MKDYFYIREVWKMSIGTETYDEKDNPANTISASSKRIAVKKVEVWIKDWIETWRFNAKDNGYIFKGFETDYKTYARLKIKTGFGMDYFRLGVVPINKCRKESKPAQEKEK